jgi:RimJ/RimL family protein N-acetyltransferase
MSSDASRRLAERLGFRPEANGAGLQFREDDYDERCIEAHRGLLAIQERNREEGAKG